MLHVWHICHHLVDWYSKCRSSFHTWNMWVYHPLFQDVSEIELICFFLMFFLLGHWSWIDRIWQEQKRTYHLVSISSRDPPKPLFGLGVWGRYGAQGRFPQKMEVFGRIWMSNNIFQCMRNACPDAMMYGIPSRKLTYPQKMAFWRWFSFSQGGIC